MQKYLLIFFALVLTASLESQAARKTIRGELLIGIEEDFKNGKVRERYYLKDRKSQKVTELVFKQKPAKELVQGDNIVASGDDYGNAFVVDSSSSAETTSVSAYDYITGFTADKPKTILIILVKMAGGIGGLSASSVEQVMYASSNSVRDMWSKNTWGRMHISGDADGDGKNDILGPVTIDSSVTESCSASTWGSEARAAVQAQYGTDFTKYTDIIYVLPDNINCNWQGYNFGNQSYLHDSSSRAAAVLAHELGHSWGLHHASIDSNNDTVVDSEYGDHSCIMGNGTSLRFVNAPHAFRIGTLSHVASSAVTLTESSTFDLYPLEDNPLNSAGPQIARLQRGTNDYLYLSFRSGQDYSTSYSGSSLTIHSAAGRPYRSLLLTSVSSGQSWTDRLSGATITVNSISNSKVSVSVVLPNLECTPVAPTISIPRSVATNATSGEKLYNFTIRNNDNLSCPTTSFQLNATAPSNMAVSFSSPSVSLKPGQSITQTLSVLFNGLTEGQNPFYISVADNDGVSPDHPLATASGTVELDTIAPSVPLNLSLTSGRKGIVNLSWQASSDGQNTYISYVIYKDSGSGFVEIGQSNSTGYSFTSSTSAQYAVAARDSAGNISARSNVVTNSVRSGGKGGK